MDFLTRKELKEFKSEVVGSSEQVTNGKYSFETELINGLGETMIEELKAKKNNPRKKLGLFKRILSVL